MTSLVDKTLQRCKTPLTALAFQQLLDFQESFLAMISSFISMPMV